MRERRQQQQQPSADTQRLLARQAGGSGSGVGVGNGDTSRSLGSSPLHGRDGSSGLLLPRGGNSSSNSGSGETP